MRCPHCKSADTEWNGETGVEATWRCNDCDEQWPGESLSECPCCQCLEETLVKCQECGAMICEDCHEDGVCLCTYEGVSP